MAGGAAPRLQPATGEADLIGSLVAALADHGAADPRAVDVPPATIDGHGHGVDVGVDTDAETETAYHDADADDADAETETETAELARLLADRLAVLEAGGEAHAR